MVGCLTWALIAEWVYLVVLVGRVGFDVLVICVYWFDFSDTLCCGLCLVVILFAGVT